jgi:hypothetical protein
MKNASPHRVLKSAQRFALPLLAAVLHSLVEGREARRARLGAARFSHT